MDGDSQLAELRSGCAVSQCPCAGDTEYCERSADKGFKAQPVLNQLIDCIRTYYNTEHLAF